MLWPGSDTCHSLQHSWARRALPLHIGWKVQLSLHQVVVKRRRLGYQKVPPKVYSGQCCWLRNYNNVCFHRFQMQHHHTCWVIWLSLERLLLFSSSVMSNSLWPNGLQHARLFCASVSPGVCSNSCSLSRWCHPPISSSVTCFSSCLQSFPASGSIPVSQLFASGDQSIGASASVSVLLMNIQGWFPLGLTALISLHSKGLSRVFSNTTVQEH